jgi:hypothetical protein
MLTACGCRVRLGPVQKTVTSAAPLSTELQSFLTRAQ